MENLKALVYNRQLTNYQKALAIREFKDMVERLELLEKAVKNNVVLPIVMPHISYFRDENGNTVDINADGINVRLKRDGTHEYFRGYGFAGVMKLTPVYTA